jgi:virulence factor Mce-like protein
MYSQRGSHGVVRRALLSLALAAILLGGAFALASRSGAGDPEYRIQFDNAFGLVVGADLEVAGVPAGKITAISLDRHNLRAVVTVSVDRAGFGDFHQSATCQTAPQSLIGEYYVNCDPGTSGPVLAPGATIPVSHTQSTIPFDLLQDMLRVPVRERLPLLIDGLGAAVAANSSNLQGALARAVPALTQTDELLSLLARNSHTLQALTSSADQVITALADNTREVQSFIDYANRAAVDAASQADNLAGTLHGLPGFLQQLAPAMAGLDRTARTYQPVLANLGAASGNLHRLFAQLPAFSRASLPALRALGKASVTGRVAVIAARPTIAQLNSFAQRTPDLSRNLAIVGRHLDEQRYAVERNPASPGGNGYTGLAALLQFAFNLAAATNYYGPYGHLLAVDGFVSQMCTPYATPQSIAESLKIFGAAYRSCYSWLGPNQPGVNEPDPTNPGACVPDPGGAPPGEPGPKTSVCKLRATSAAQRPIRVLGGRASPTRHASGGGLAGPSARSGPSGQAAGLQQLLDYLVSP